MAIKTNKELAEAVNDAIKNSGITKAHIARQLEISRQAFDKMLEKQSFSIDDANKILAYINQEAIVNVIKK